MFIGNLVKLKSNIARINIKDKEFIKNVIKKHWIWLVTGMDDEDLDYAIQPMYLDTESRHMILLGGELLVLHDEIEKVELNRNELFMVLNNQMCNC